jgi:TFIIF-interacting CTD phosphatase-like protein
MLEVLKELSQHFEIILFTAAVQYYADTIVEGIEINETSEIFEHVLCRKECIHISMENEDV